MQKLLGAVIFLLGLAASVFAQEPTLPPGYQTWPERHEFSCLIGESQSTITTRFFGKLNSDTSRIEVVMLVLVDADIFSVTHGEISSREGSRTHSYSVQTFEGWTTFDLSMYTPAAEAKKAEEEAIREITGTTSAHIETMCRIREKLQEIKALLWVKLTFPGGKK